MKIGIDFDNTIISYDPLFQKFADRNKIKIPHHSNPKNAVKSFILQKPKGNLQWTALQGEIYGKKIAEAKLSDDFLNFLDLSKKSGHDICIVSHKSIFNSISPYYDLQKAAKKWLSKNKVTIPSRVDEKACFFELTQEEKIFRIQKEKCDIFIDDLIEIFNHKEFPKYTHKILFGIGHPSHQSIYSWQDASKIIEKISKKSKKISKRDIETTALLDLNKNHYKQKIRKILRIPDRDTIKFETLNEGRNNRVYKVVHSDKVFLAKAYFKNTNDNRNRQNSEITFLNFLNQSKTEWVPKVINNDLRYGISILSWIEGSTFEMGQIVKFKIWKQCLSFINFIQSLRKSKLAKTIPTASEAAFSYQEHLGILQKRHDSWLRFINSNKGGDLPNEIKKLILGDIEHNYCLLTSFLISHHDFRKKVPQEAQIISPSDFGLHNAILQGNSRLRFIDFEYAGWDDPAKMLADFFAQPDIPVPRELYMDFKELLSDHMTESQKQLFYKRLPVIEKIIRLKWCYIILNPWHPIDKKRRKFACAKDEEMTITISKIKNLLKNKSFENK